jgi:hypothetical protein
LKPEYAEYEIGSGDGKFRIFVRNGAPERVENVIKNHVATKLL